MKQRCSVPLDHADLAELYQQYAPKIFNYVQKHVSSFQDAEDILIEVFVAALESTRFAVLREQEQQAWLWRVARNKVVDTYRQSQRLRSLPLKNIDEQMMEDADLNPEQISIQQEEDDYLALQIRRLSPLQQQVLYLRFGEHLRCAQIAAKIGQRESSVRAMVSRILNLLRRQCDEQEEGGNHSGTIQ